MKNLLVLLLLTNSIAYSQSTLDESQIAICDSVWVCRDKAIECVRCLMNEPVKDSLIVRLQEKNEIQAGAIENLVEANDKQAEVIVLKDQRIAGLNEEIGRQKKRTLFAGILSGVGGVVVGWLASLF